MPRKHLPPRPFISFDHVSLRLGDTRAFVDLRWTLHEGEQWAIVGANGSGKSALLKAFTGETPVVDGEIHYHFAGPRQGADYATVPEQDIACVSVDEHRALVAHAMSYHQARWTPLGETDDVATAGALVGESATRRAVRRAAELLGIQPLLTRPITQLSNGEMRKTLLARALAQAPRLLLLDNPFAGLDRESRRALTRLLNTLMAEGLSTVLATARPEELPSRITHVLLVDGHRVVKQGRRRVMCNDPEVVAHVNTPGKEAEPSTVLPPMVPRRGVPETLAELNAVSVVYGRARVLDRVDWTIRCGEKWALLGPNGAGKSTLLSLIVGDNPQAYANDITLFGMRRGTGESIWDIKARVGWMAPELQFHYDAETAALDVVSSGFFDSVGLHNLCTPSQRRTARRWLRALGLETHPLDPFGSLSDGEQRLVLLARALVKRPWLVVLDEPAQGLDAGNRARVLAVVSELCRQPGTTLVMVTHHASELPAGITHELRLRAGRVTRRFRRRHNVSQST